MVATVAMSSLLRDRKEAGSAKRIVRQNAKSKMTAQESWLDARRYAVIVDAGSSGSRLQVYSWKDPSVERLARQQAGESVKILPVVEKGVFGTDQEWQLKVEPGLSSFGTHAQDLAGYLRPLFDHARAIIPADALASTPVYVLATAGMRLLPEGQRAAVLRETCAYIQHSTPFHITDERCAQNVQVITGEEEGLLGWIAINYLMDGFKYRAGSTEATKGKSTYGFLDMGGASTQIAFEPKQGNEETLSPVTLRMLDGTDVIHNVFVTTFLGYGTNRARERYVQSLDAKTLSDPCLPVGLRVKSQDRDLVGTGSFAQCLESLSPLLEKNAACSHPPCLFHGVHVPPIDFSVNHFIGVSEYWFSSNDVYSLGGAYDFVAFQKAAQDFCGRKWTELDADLRKGDVFGKQVNEERLEMQCFKSAWMATVLHEGIGLPRIIDDGGKGDGRQHANDAQGKADEKNLFQSVNDVKGLSVSWTLGKAVLEASREIKPSLPGSSPDSVGLPANASEVKDIAMVPIHPDPGIIQYKEQYDWSSQPEHLLIEAQQSVQKHQFASAAILLVVLAILVLCCMLRGKSSTAKRRRTALKDIACSPCYGWRARQTMNRGDYTLANMEEGSHDLQQLHRKASNTDVGDKIQQTRVTSPDVVSVSDPSSDEYDDSKSRRARRAPNLFLKTLVVPWQRLNLALGVTSSSRPTSPRTRRYPNGRSGHSRRLTSGDRAPVRYSASATPVASSQPGSPRPFPRSKPSQHKIDVDASIRQPSLPVQLQHSTNAVLAVTSARSSRAASPAFGNASNVVTTRPNTPGSSG